MTGSTSIVPLLPITVVTTKELTKAVVPEATKQMEKRSGFTP
jgi:hypothetical protein